MRVVVLDTISPGGGLSRLVMERLSSNPVFDQVIEVRWPARADGAEADGVEAFARQVEHADAVVTLPWTSAQPMKAVSSHWLGRIRQVCEALAEVAVPAFVFGSSALVYSPSLTEEPVEESWPATGLRNLGASRVLVQAEETVADFARLHGARRVVILRPALPVDPAHWGTRQRRASLHGLRRQLDRDTSVQFVDIADLPAAYERALTESVSGPFNLAADRLALRELVDAARQRLHWWERLSPRSADGTSAWFAAAARSPALDTGRAKRELHWQATAQAVDVLDVVRGCVSDQALRAPGDPGTTTPEADAEAATLYEHALSYFDTCASGVSGEGWNAAAWSGAGVRDLVAQAARDQYRVALLVGGRSPEEAEHELPMDPLGVNPADGWRLASERARLALGSGNGDTIVLAPGTARLLRDAAFDLLVRGWAVARAAETSPFVPDDLAVFTREQALTSGTVEPGDISLDELFASVLAAHPPTTGTAPDTPAGATGPDAER